MLINLLDTFSSLDEKQKKTIYNCINNLINPFKIYLFLLILILLINLCFNIYYFNKIILKLT